MKKAWGQLTIINLYGVNKEAYGSPAKLKEFIRALCREIRMKPYGAPLVKRFGQGRLEGYSAMQFIETSSITLHTEETQDRIFLDIFSCRAFDAAAAVRFSREFFAAAKASSRTIRRD